MLDQCAMRSPQPDNQDRAGYPDRYGDEPQHRAWFSGMSGDEAVPDSGQKERDRNPQNHQDNRQQYPHDALMVVDAQTLRIVAQPARARVIHIAYGSAVFGG
jgi:hypothetical protein